MREAGAALRLRLPRQTDQAGRRNRDTSSASVCARSFIDEAAVTVCWTSAAFFWVI